MIWAEEQTLTERDHVLLRQAARRAANADSAPPAGYVYSTTTGAWVSASDPEKFLAGSADQKKVKTKKHDVESGEDRK